MLQKNDLFTEYKIKLRYFCVFAYESPHVEERELE